MLLQSSGFIPAELIRGGLMGGSGIFADDSLSRLLERSTVNLNPDA
jgi:hypothetical protein